jgi:hypothetical protein
MAKNEEKYTHPDLRKEIKEERSGSSSTTSSDTRTARPSLSRWTARIRASDGRGPRASRLTVHAGVATA